MQRLKFLDLFSGIGGFRTGMIKAGNKPAGWCDIDKFARKSYQNMYNTEGEWNGKDINAVSNTDWKEINKKYGPINVLCGGFPCQSFSIAGKRKGFLDKTRGTLFFQVARAAKEIKPQYLFLENVKGLLNHRHGETFATILSTLDEIGYDAEWQVLNSKNFGVPQNRERIYIIGHIRTASTQQIFDWGQETQTNSKKLNTYHKGKHESTYVYKDNGLAPTLSATDYKHPIHIIKSHNSKNERKRIYDTRGVAPTVSATEYKDPLKVSYFHKSNHITGRIYNTDGVSPTIRTCQGGNQEPIIAQNKNNPKINYYHKDNKMDNRILNDTGIGSSIRATGHSPKVAVKKKPSLKVREATKKGYAEAYPGDSVNMSYPKSKTRRGRVGHKVVNTLTASNTNGTQECVVLNNKKKLNKVADKAFDIAQSHRKEKLGGYSVRNGNIRIYKNDKKKTGVSDMQVSNPNGYASTSIASRPPKTYSLKDLQIRKLTPKECWRLQGFPDSLYEKAKEVNSNSQLYKQAGNSVSVPVIEFIASRMKILD